MSSGGRTSRIRRLSEGWLIFRTGPSELGVHPTSGTWEGAEFSHPVHHEISLMCDDIAATKAELEGKGAVFTGDVIDEGFGLTASMQLPGAGQILLYEPRHPTAYDSTSDPSVSCIGVLRDDMSCTQTLGWRQTLGWLGLGVGPGRCPRPS